MRPIRRKLAKPAPASHDERMEARPTPSAPDSSDPKAQRSLALDVLAGGVPGPLHFDIDDRQLAGAVLAAMDALVAVLSPEGVILSLNAACERLLGYDVRDIIGRPFWTLVDPASVDALQQVHEDLLRTRNPHRSEFTWITSSGDRRNIAWSHSVMLDADGSVRCLIATGLDTTASFQAQQALHDNEARLRGILQTAADAVVTIDAQGIVELFNPAAERMFGYAAAEVIGRNISMLMPEPYRREHDSYLRNYLHTGEAKIVGIGREVVARRKDGSLFPVDLAVSEVRLDHRIIFTGILRDLTERKRLEQEIATISESEQRRIGQDLHDGLGQQLTGLAFLAGALQQRLEGSSEGAAAERIAQAADRAIDHTRRLARGLSPVQLAGNHLVPALHQLADDAHRLFGIQCQIHGELPFETGDVALHLYRIAQEAVTNAAKHGKATRIVIRLTREDDRITLRIEDNGRGLPPQGPNPHGAGIRNMSHRARMIGGKLALEPLPAGGVAVICSFHQTRTQPRREP